MENEPVKTIGMINPGAMGISVAATMQNSGCEVLWASEGRSAESKRRAAEHGLVDAGSIFELARRSRVLVSVCPPHAAEDVAGQAIDAGFQGIFLDANAISPQKAERINTGLTEAGIRFVDGGIIGGPAWEPGQTWLYLSGPEVEQVLPFFAAGPLETEVVGPDIGQASALKMVFSAYTKGTSALLSAILASAQELGVRSNLEKQWERYWPGFAEETQGRVRRVTAKAWRFAGEMHEVADTFEDAGMPGGFFEGSAEIYQRMAEFKDRKEKPELAEVMMTLMRDK